MDKRKIIEALHKNLAGETKDKLERHSDAEAMLDRFGAMIKTPSEKKRTKDTPGGTKMWDYKLFARAGGNSLISKMAP